MYRENDCCYWDGEKCTAQGSLYGTCPCERWKGCATYQPTYEEEKVPLAITTLYAQIKDLTDAEIWHERSMAAKRVVYMYDLAWWMKYVTTYEFLRRCSDYLHKIAEPNEYVKTMESVRDTGLEITPEMKTIYAKVKHKAWR